MSSMSTIFFYGPIDQGPAVKECVGPRGCVVGGVLQLHQRAQELDPPRDHSAHRLVIAPHARIAAGDNALSMHAATQVTSLRRSCNLPAGE